MADPSSQTRAHSPARKQRNLRLVRGGWIVLALVALATFVLSVPMQMDLQTPCPEPQPTPECDAFRLDAAGVAALHQTGLTLEAYSAIVVSARVLAEVIFIVVGVMIFWARSDDPMALLVATMLLLVGATSGTTTLIWANVLPGLAVVDVLVQQGQAVTVIVFLFLFPNWRFVPRWAPWMIAPLAAMGVLYGLQDLGLSRGTILDPVQNSTVDVVGGLMWVAAILTGLGAQVHRYARVSSVLERQQTKWVVLGLAASILLSIPAGIPNRVIQPGTAVHVVSVVLNVVSFSALAIAVGIAIRRHRLWDIEVIVNRALIYGALSAVLAGIFAASVVLINAVVRDFSGEEATTTAGVVSAILVASVFQPLRTWVEKWINAHLYPDSINLKREFVEFLPEVRNVIRLRELLLILTAKLAGLLGVTHTAIFLANRKGAFRRAQAYPAGTELGDFNPDPRLRTELLRGRVVSKGDQQGLWAPLYLPRARDREVIGVLDIGPRKNRTGFSGDEIRALSQLGAEIGISVYTAQLRARRR
jgi:hypothetical protein